LYFQQLGLLHEPGFDIDTSCKHRRAGRRPCVRDSDSAGCPDERHEGEQRISDVSEQPVRDQRVPLFRSDSDPPRSSHVALCTVGADQAGRDPDQVEDTQRRHSPFCRCRESGAGQPRHGAGNDEGAGRSSNKGAPRPSRNPVSPMERY